MSCWIVSARHIDTLVSAAIYGGLALDGTPVTVETADAVGSALWLTNHRSWNHRYRVNDACPAYRFRLVANFGGSAELLKAVDCYAYQACEHPGWLASAERLLCAELEALCVDGAGVDDADELRGWAAYQDAPWGIDEIPSLVCICCHGSGRDWGIDAAGRTVEMTCPVCGGNGQVQAGDDAIAA